MSKQTQGQVLKFTAVLMQNLPEMSGERMQDWLEHPGYMKRALKSVFCPEGDMPDLKKIGKIFKVRLNKNLKTEDDFCEAFMMERIWTGPAGVPCLLGNFVRVNEVDVDLFVASVAELGFQSTAMVKWVLQRAMILGLEYCPFEVAINFILQNRSQSKGERICICTPTDSFGAMQALYCEHNGTSRSSEKRYITGSDLLFGTDLLAFVVPTSKKAQ